MAKKTSMAEKRKAKTPSRVSFGGLGDNLTAEVEEKKEETVVNIETENVKQETIIEEEKKDAASEEVVEEDTTQHTSMLDAGFSQMFENIKNEEPKVSETPTPDELEIERKKEAELKKQKALEEKERKEAIEKAIYARERRTYLIANYLDKAANLYADEEMISKGDVIEMALEHFFKSTAGRKEIAQQAKDFLEKNYEKLEKKRKEKILIKC